MMNAMGCSMSKSLSWPVIAPTVGIIVGRVTSGKNRAGKVRHIAYLGKGRECQRLGTFDTFREAKQKVINDWEVS